MDNEKPILKQPKTNQSPRGVLENLAKFIGKCLFWDLFVNKCCGMVDCNFIDARLQYRGFPVKFPKFSRTPFLKKTSGRLLMEMTQEKIWHFGEILCKMYVFLTRCRHYIISCDMQHIQFQLHFCENFHKKSLPRNLIVIWQDFTYFLNNALEHGTIILHLEDLKKIK